MSFLYNSETAIYRSGTNYWEYFTGRIASIVGIISAVLHFSENPVAISIIVVFLLTLVLFFHEEQISIFEDRFTYRSGFVLPNNIEGKEYHYADVREIVYPVDENRLNDSVRNFKKGPVDVYRSILLFFKDGSSMLLTTGIDYYSLEKAVKMIKEKLY